MFVFASQEPEGICISLPRTSGNTVRLNGVICLGKESSKACFWDNQKNDQLFTFPKGEVLPITEFAGGPELDDGAGGTCTNCHAGENPYIIHPNTPLGKPALSAYPLFSDDWYEPLVHTSWPQNPGPMANGPEGNCNFCHTDGGSGGRFPELSSNISGYCSAVLSTAIIRTMPPFNPNDPSYAAHASALEALCSQP